jgi:hypothetical protein
VEVVVSGHVGTQVGTEISKTLTLTFQASGNAWYNPSAGKYEPLMLIVHQPYLDYQIDLVQLIGGSPIPANINGLTQFAVNIPVSSGTWYETKFLSNYNAAKARDLPGLSVSRLPGVMSSYQTDDAYTSASNSWPGPNALSQYTGQQETVVTVSEATHAGWQKSVNVDAHGEISGNLGGISVGFVATAGLSRTWLYSYAQTTTFSIGGMAPRLSVYVTDDSYPGEQYEVYAYWSRAYLTRYTVGSSPTSPGFSIWVLDWKVPYLNEGYPATISSTTADTTSVLLGWISAGGVNPSGVYRRAGYYVQWSTSSTFSTVYSSPLLSPDATSYSVTGLASGTTYYFRVKAVFNSASGYTNLSGVVSVTTLPVGGGGGGGGGCCRPTFCCL